MEERRIQSERVLNRETEWEKNGGPGGQREEKECNSKKEIKAEQLTAPMSTQRSPYSYNST